MQGRRIENLRTNLNIENVVPFFFWSHRNFDVNSREFSKFLLLCENSACTRMLFIDRLARFFIRNYFKTYLYRSIFNSYFNCFLIRFKRFHVLVTKMFAIEIKKVIYFVYFIFRLNFFFFTKYLKNLIIRNIKKIMKLSLSNKNFRISKLNFHLIERATVAT